MALAFRLHYLICLIMACSVAEKGDDVSLTEDIFGYLEDKTPVKRYTWTNKHNITVQVINFGGRITCIKVPDRNGNIEDIVLGYDQLEGYMGDNPYFGAILGRVASRITGASFTLDGVQYNLTANNNGNTLHGGTKGFDKVLWEPYVHDKQLTLTYISKDGENGFPGTVLSQVTYELTSESELIFNAHAMTTKPTPINIANHPYYNLAGQNAGPEGVYKHTVSINADKYMVFAPDGAPTGEIRQVDGTHMDLRMQQSLGPLIKQRGGFDDYYCVDLDKNNEMQFLARVEHPESGRALEVHSNQPGVVFYTGTYLPKKGSKEAIIGKGGIEYNEFGALCLETEGYPDAVNHANFPSMILKPGDVYHHASSFKFYTKK